MLSRTVPEPSFSTPYSENPLTGAHARVVALGNLAESLPETGIIALLRMRNKSATWARVYN
jgi:hypothetical protein